MKPEPRIEVRSPLYALAYAQMVPVAREHGYALGLHGSMARDLDVVAVPWVEGASKPEVLLDALTACLGWDKANGHGSPGWKPHGRLAYTIVNHETGLWVDLSVVPLQALQTPSTEAALAAKKKGE